MNLFYYITWSTLLYYIHTEADDRLKVTVLLSLSLHYYYYYYYTITAWLRGDEKSISISQLPLLSFVLISL